MFKFFIKTFPFRRYLIFSEIVFPAKWRLSFMRLTKTIILVLGETAKRIVWPTKTSVAYSNEMRSTSVKHKKPKQSIV